MKGYTKSDVTCRRVGYGGHAFPTVNVKSYAYIGTERVIDRFGCSEATAQRALEWVWESACESFWEKDGDAHELADHYLSRYAYHVRDKVNQDGRSGGWLVVDGLPEVSEWDGALLNSWALFERAIRRAVDYLTSWEWAEDMIAANEWALDHAAIERMLEEAAA